MKRSEFVDQIKQIAVNKLVFIDESGADDKLVVLRGWAPKGLRSYAQQKGFRSKRLSLIAGYVYGKKQIIAPFEFSGYTDTDLFNGWFESVLCPCLTAGQVVIMDNASFHKSPELERMAAAVGCTILYLPPYSPDLNPIEKFWANLKRKIRQAIQKAFSLEDAITYAFQRT